MLRLFLLCRTVSPLLTRCPCASAMSAHKRQRHGLGSVQSARAAKLDASSAVYQQLKAKVHKSAVLDAPSCCGVAVVPVVPRQTHVHSAYHDITARQIFHNKVQPLFILQAGNAMSCSLVQNDVVRLSRIQVANVDSVVLQGSWVIAIMTHCKLRYCHSQTWKE